MVADRRAHQRSTCSSLRPRFRPLLSPEVRGQSRRCPQCQESHHARIRQGLRFCAAQCQSFICTDVVCSLQSVSLTCPPRHLGSQAPYSITTIPRARRVHQSLVTTPLSSGWSLVICIYHVTLLPLLSGKPWADVLVLNGPGTCVMLCVAVYLNKVILLYSISGTTVCTQPASSSLVLLLLGLYTWSLSPE